MPLSRQRVVRVADPYKANCCKLLHKSLADDIRPYTIVSIYNIKIVCLTAALPSAQLPIHQTDIKEHFYEPYNIKTTCCS